MAEADAYVVNNEFGEIVEREGGDGTERLHDRATRRATSTRCPANRFELWAYLESGRFLTPVFREFYKERDVVTEERRMRTDSEPDRPPRRAVPRGGVHRAPLRPAR